MCMGIFASPVIGNMLLTIARAAARRGLATAAAAAEAAPAAAVPTLQSAVSIVTCGAPALARGSGGVVLNLGAHTDLGATRPSSHSSHAGQQPLTED